MENKEKKELLEKTFDRLLQWIQAADTKIAPVLAINTSMIALVAAFSSDFTNWQWYSIIITLISSILSLTSIILLSFVTFPRTSSPKGSIFYFKDINDSNYENYRDDIMNISTDIVIDDLIKQCYRNAQIANQKYKYLKLSMLAMFINIIPWIITIILLYRG